MVDEAVFISGFVFSLQIWGYAVHGHSDLAIMAEQRPDDQTFLSNWWDRTPTDIAHERIDRGNGWEPVPLWWALRGARGREDFMQQFDGQADG